MKTIKEGYILLDTKEFLEIYGLNIKEGSKIFGINHLNEIKHITFNKKDINTNCSFVGKLVDEFGPIFKIIIPN